MGLILTGFRVVIQIRKFTSKFPAHLRVISEVFVVNTLCPLALPLSSVKCVLSSDVDPAPDPVGSGFILVNQSGSGTSLFVITGHFSLHFSTVLVTQLCHFFICRLFKSDFAVFLSYQCTREKTFNILTWFFFK